jgi:hypothetical protein
LSYGFPRDFRPKVSNVPKEFFSKLNAQREDIGGKRLTEKAFKAGIEGKFQPESTSQNREPFNEGTIFNSPEHLTAAVVDKGIGQMLQDKGYSGGGTGGFPHGEGSIQWYLPQDPKPIPEGYHSWSDYKEGDPNYNPDAPTPTIDRPGFEPSKEDLKLIQMQGDGSKPQIKGGKYGESTYIVQKTDFDTEGKIASWTSHYMTGSSDANYQREGGQGQGECCVFNPYGGGGCGTCNKGASSSRIVFSELYGLT